MDASQSLQKRAQAWSHLPFSLVCPVSNLDLRNCNKINRCCFNLVFICYGSNRKRINSIKNVCICLLLFAQTTSINIQNILGTFLSMEQVLSGRRQIRIGDFYGVSLCIFQILNHLNLSIPKISIHNLK